MLRAEKSKINPSSVQQEKPTSRPPPKTLAFEKGVQVSTLDVTIAASLTPLPRCISSFMGFVDGWKLLSRAIWYYFYTDSCTCRACLQTEGSPLAVNWACSIETPSPAVSLHQWPRDKSLSTFLSEHNRLHQYDQWYIIDILFKILISIFKILFFLLKKFRVDFNTLVLSIEKN